MTIRRRLFLSNLLMLLLPVLASILFAYAILFFFSAHSSVPMERAFPRAFDIIWRFQRRQDVDALLADVRDFNAGLADSSVYMAVMREDGFLYPETAAEALQSNGLLATLLQEDFTGNLTMNHTRVMIERSGEYRLLIVDSRFGAGAPRNVGRPVASQVFLIFGGVVLIAVLTNRLLTHLVTRSVTGSLDTLVDGVHQLRDGNLDYRIFYKRRDEFAPVCEDFNEMAEHLQRLIEHRQKDDLSRRELLAGISHDLRTPLTSIKAYVEGLLDGVAEDADTRLRYLDTIRRKAGEIDALVDKLFLFSKLEIGEFPLRFERLELGAALSSLIKSAGEEYLSRGLQIKRAEAPGELWVRADPVQLHNAVVNLLENSASYKNKELGVATVAWRDEGSHAALTVTDDGPGVPPDCLENIFNVFYRVDPSRRNPAHGSGLGLAITRRIMELMGGGVRAENMESGGLRITLYLPKWEDSI